MKLRWRALGRHVSLASAALVCAVVLWAYLDSFVEDERTFATCASLEGLAPGRALFEKGRSPLDGSGPLVPSLWVTVRGPSRAVRTLDPGRIVLERPLEARAHEGIRRLLLSPGDFAVLGGTDLRVVRVEPAELLAIGPE